MGDNGLFHLKCTLGATDVSLSFKTMEALGAFLEAATFSEEGVRGEISVTSGRVTTVGHPDGTTEHNFRDL
jgi:hypothetical protein